MRTIVFTAAALLSVLAACSGGGGGAMIPTDGDAGAEGADGGPSVTDSGEGEEEDTPHALGTIALGEVHESGESEMAPLVSIGFVPNVPKRASCATKLEGCEVTKLPRCTAAKTFTGCEADEVCTWDDACRATCTAVPRCATACKDDEICAADPKTPEAGRCQKRESFDAGPVAFSGTSMSISLFPPYSFEPDEDGAPFVSGAALRVKAQGAVGAGFEAFEESFTATTFIQTKPSLHAITRESVFGTGPLAVGWMPGEDVVLVTVTSEHASATCKAKDSSGKLDVPRAVIDAVRAAPDEGSPSGSLTIAISRERRELKKNKKTKGKLEGTKVEPVGWLALVTSSAETASFEACSSGFAACGDACVDVRTDAANCGACGVACASAETCVAGKCKTGVCATGAENTLARCTDGCSNDGDPYIDCDDYDCCPVVTNCPATTACGK